MRKIKKRYLFPVVYLAVLGLAFIAPALFNVIFLLSIPSMLVVSYFDFPPDPTYLVFTGAVGQWFLIGALFDTAAAAADLLARKNG